MSPADAPKVAFVSLGCPKNLVDSERILAGLALGGFLLTDEPDGAELVVVNTCAFIDLARAESDEWIDELEELKRAGRLGRIVVAGCMAQRYGPRLLARHPDIDAVAGLADRDRLAEVCRAALARDDAGAPLVRVGPHAPTAPSDRERLRLTPRHYAYLRITEGCDNRCAYCTIPAIRGPLRSKPPEEVLAEANELVADGVRELVLIGQDTTAYGRDAGSADDDVWTLSRLLATLRDESGAEWIRTLYAHPASLTDETIAELGRGLPVVPYVDLPLQHINDPILASMGRRVTRADIAARVARLRNAVPNVTLRTSFIVGYPGETDAAFEELEAFVEEVRFDHVGVFVYSPEEGTPAAGLPDQMPRGVREDRWDRLMQRADRLAREAAEPQVGQEMDVLVDGPAEHAEGWVAARHSGQAPEIDTVVLLPEGAAAPGERLCVRITGTDGADLLGEPVSTARGSADRDGDDNP